MITFEKIICNYYLKIETIVVHLKGKKRERERGGREREKQTKKSFSNYWNWIIIKNLFLNVPH